MTEKELDEINKGDELVLFRIPRAEAEILRDIIKERATYNLVTTKLRNNWMWIVAGGILTVYALWEKVQGFTGVIK